jgi:hypothetical protein
MNMLNTVTGPSCVAKFRTSALSGRRLSYIPITSAWQLKGCQHSFEHYTIKASLLKVPDRGGRNLKFFLKHQLVHYCDTVLKVNLSCKY